MNKNIITWGVCISVLFGLSCLANASSKGLSFIEERESSAKGVRAKEDTLDYQKFLKKARKYKRPFLEKYLPELLSMKAVFIREDIDIGVDLKDLAQYGLNIEFLLKQVNRSKLDVTIINRKQYADYMSEQLVFHDPWVGTFNVMLYRPLNKKHALPAIIGLHGHGEDYEIFYDKYYGRDFIQKGFCLIIPNFRAMDFDKMETEISKELYLNGFTLMGLHVYETHLVVKYLEAKEYVDSQRIGLFAHSGGSTVSLFMSIFSSAIKVQAFDKPLQLINNLCFGRMHCETIPLLSPYTPRLFSFSTTQVISKMFPYSYPVSEKEKLLHFFVNNL